MKIKLFQNGKKNNWSKISTQDKENAKRDVENKTRLVAKEYKQ